MRATREPARCGYAGLRAQHFRTSGPRELRKRVLPRLLQPLLHLIGPRVTCVAQRAWLLSSSFSSFSMQCDVSISCVCARATQDLEKLSKKELIDRIEKAAEVLLEPEVKALDAAVPDKKDATGKALEAAVPDKKDDGSTVDQKSGADHALLG